MTDDELRTMMRDVQRQRVEQVRDPDLWLIHTSCHLEPGVRSCCLARDLSGVDLGRDDIRDLPLDGCDQADCTCTYEMQL